MGVLPEEGVAITIPPIPASGVAVAVWTAAAVGPAGAVIAMTMVVGVGAAWFGALLPVGGMNGDAVPQAARIKAMHSIAKICTGDRRFLNSFPPPTFRNHFSLFGNCPGEQKGQVPENHNFSLLLLDCSNMDIMCQYYI
jgi:hypothetical protein